MGMKLMRNIVFNHLKKKSKKGIFLLQETHSCKEFEKNGKMSGVGIYISRMEKQTVVGLPF